MGVWNNAGHYLLRPEAAEAIFYMFYYTGDPKYRRMAGEIMEAISPFGMGDKKWLRYRPLYSRPSEQMS